MSVAAIVLAAGTSSRYRAKDGSVPSKLLAELDGVPLVRHVVGAASRSHASPVVVVTGHADAQIRAALSSTDTIFAHNPRFVEGIATSLRTGLAAVPADAAGALVLLADMPFVDAELLDRLIAEFERGGACDAVVPVHGGRPGNPVLLGRSLFAAASRLEGDAGARRLLSRANVREIAAQDDAVAVDIDDPAMLRHVSARLR